MAELVLVPGEMTDGAGWHWLEFAPRHPAMAVRSRAGFPGNHVPWVLHHHSITALR